ncbi:MAG: DoxX family protein [Acidimicrobiales bacterium]
MKILERILVVVLAIVFAAAAVNKIVSSESRDLLADQLGVPGWFLVAVGLAELLLVVDLILPRFRILGGIGVFVFMIGAAIFGGFGETVDDNDPQLAIPLNIVLALLGLTLAWLAAGRPRSLRALLAAAKSQALGQAALVGETAADVIS